MLYGNVPQKLTMKNTKLEINSHHDASCAIEYAFKMVLTNCCYQIVHHIEKCAGTPMPSKTTSTVMWKSVLVPQARYYSTNSKLRLCDCIFRNMFDCIFQNIS